MNMFILMIIFSIMFILMSNISIIYPIVMMIILLIYSSYVCLKLSMWKSNYLYSIMLFLITISGLLIIFLYFSSLISNEHINFKFNKFLFMSFIINLMTFLFNWKYNYNFHSYTMKYNYSKTNQFMNMNNMIYLLITPFSIIKICSLKIHLLTKN